MKTTHIVAFILLIIGGLNWGLVGIFNFNLVEKIFGAGVITNIIYILVGLAALWELFVHRKGCKTCAMPKDGMMKDDGMIKKDGMMK